MTIYVERANGRLEFWTYSDTRRIYLSGSTVARWLARGTAKLVEV